MPRLPPEAIPVVVPGADYSKLKFGPTEGFVLSRVDGSTNIKSICHLAGLPEAETLTLLLNFAEWGLVQFKNAKGEALRPPFGEDGPGSAPVGPTPSNRERPRVKLTRSILTPSEPSSAPAAAPNPAAEKAKNDRLAMALQMGAQADRLFYDSDFTNAHSFYKLALSYDPGNKEYQKKVALLEPKVVKKTVDSKWTKARELLDKGDNPGAIRALREIVASDKKDAAARYELARLLLPDLRQDDAKLTAEIDDLVERACMLEPRKIEYLALAGRVTQLLGKTDRALVYFKSVLKLDPKHELALKALKLLDSGKTDWVG